MKGKIIISIIFLLMIILVITLVIATEVSYCKKDCSFNKRIDIKTCNNAYKECRQVCNDNKKSCLYNVSEDYQICKEECDLLIDKRTCKRECVRQKIHDKKNCSKRECLAECRKERKNCKRYVKVKWLDCRYNCSFSQVSLSQEECENAGGFFHQICNGVYYDIICSPDKFCICDGFGDYQCPANYSCNHNIKKYLPRKQHTVKGYKDLLGNALGNIGVCMKD